MPEIAINLLQNNFAAFAARFESKIKSVEEFRGDLRVVMLAGDIIEAARYLLHEMDEPLPTLVDLFGMDYSKASIETPERFAVIYQFANWLSGKRIWLKVFANEDEPKIPSITGLTPAANWFEREAWDLFGIVFEGHPGLIRILCHSEFEGHPLRKEYPSAGFQRLHHAISSKEL